jgi:hypothetical protein
MILHWILYLGKEALPDGRVQKIKTILVLDNESPVIGPIFTAFVSFFLKTAFILERAAYELKS